MVWINQFGAPGRAWKWRRRAAGLLATGLVAAVAGPAAAAPSPPTLAFTPSSYSYGRVTPGQTASQTFTLTNSGGSASGAVTITLTATAKKAKTTPTLTTRPGSCVVPEGSPRFPCDAEDSASLTGVTRPASRGIAGTLNFTLYGPSATPRCSGKPAFPTQSEGVTLSSNGGYFIAVPVSEAGKYWWVVSYTGDANNNPVTSRCGAESTTAWMTA